MKKTWKEEAAPTPEYDFYVVTHGLLSKEQAQAVRDNLRDFSVCLVQSNEETGSTGTALVLSSEDSEWFATNRPDLKVVGLTGSSLQALTSLYGLFGRTLPPILQEGNRPETMFAATDPVFAPVSEEWTTSK